MGPNFAYSADYNDSLILQYSVNPNTGVIGTTAVSSTTDAGNTDYVAVNQAANILYATESSGNAVSEYSIAKTTGALTKVGSVATGIQPVSITINAAGTYAYVVDSNSADVYQYSISQTTGLLTYVSSTVTGGSGPSYLTINPAGTYAYVSNSSSNSISVFSINSTTGGLSPIAGSPFTTTSPYDVTFNPAGTLAYVPTFGGNSIAVYSIDPGTGAIGAAITGSPFVSGTSSRGIVLNANGTFAYSVNGGTGNRTTPDGSVTEYSVNTTTGALTQIGTVTSNVGVYSNCIAINAADTVVYVVNNWGPAVTEYSINQSTGVLTALGTVPLSSSAATANSISFATE